jgi:putative N6-adenine-specific DNA methylase
MRLFVTCAQGLEELLEAEIKELGFSSTLLGFRGVHVDVEESLTPIYALNYQLRLASRVLMPLREFRCYDQQSLYKAARSIEWDRYIPKNKTFAIDANVSHKHLRNSHYAGLVVKDAICDQLREIRGGERPSVDVKTPDVQLNLFIHDWDANISFDTSGTPLYKRGYRVDGVEAPIQESLAAAILRLADFKGSETVIDPCCGSGTLLIEAALIATKTPPGYLRREWGFFHHPDFSQVEWLKVKAAADAERRPLEAKNWVGIDINKRAAQAARANLRGAGFHQNVTIIQSDFREFTPKELPDLLICNPPHGKRLDDVEHLRPLYRALGDFMKRQMAKPARGFIFTGSLELSKEVGLAPKRRHVIQQSGEEARLLAFDLY